MKEEAHNGIPIPPAAAHLFKLYGVKVFKRPQKEVDSGRGRFPAEWVRFEGGNFLRPVADGGTYERDDVPGWYWCAPVPLAILVQNLGTRTRGEEDDSVLAMATWAAQNIEMDALDAMWRLSNGAVEYIAQVRTVFADGFYKREEKKDDS